MSALSAIGARVKPATDAISRTAYSITSRKGNALVGGAVGLTATGVFLLPGDSQGVQNAKIGASVAIAILGSVVTKGHTPTFLGAIALGMAPAYVAALT